MIPWKSIWKVPLFCAVAGYINFWAAVRLLQWAIVRLPDGTITSDNTKVLIVYGAIFLINLLVGGLVFFRKSTRREIFWSASLLAVYGLVLILVQWGFQLTTGPAAVWLIYLFRPFEMSLFVSQIFLKLGATGGVILWIAAILEVLTPYLFVLFGKKEALAKPAQPATPPLD